jgi:hypothetical protein
MFAHSTADAKDTGVSFSTVANSNKTILISVCEHGDSICHKWGDSLKAQFGNLTYNRVNVNSDTGAHFVDKPGQSINDKYENILFTGCSLHMPAVNIVDQLESGYGFTNLQSIFFIIPASAAATFAENYQHELLDFKHCFTATSYSIDLVIPGVHFEPTNNADSKKISAQSKASILSSHSLFKRQADRPAEIAASIYGASKLEAADKDDVDNRSWLEKVFCRRS